MRELKFRAWVYYGDELEKPHYSRDYGSLDRFFEDHSENDIGQCIEQYTGLKDKNGKEIYEGDVVKGGWLYGKNWQVVKYQNYGFYPFIVTDFDGDSMVRNVDIEVIGNVHENADLLEEEE